MNRFLWCLLINYVISVPGVGAIVEVGYFENNEVVTVSDSSTPLYTDLVRVGYAGNSNRFSIVNGAAVSANECQIAFTSFMTGYIATDNEIDVSGVGSRLNSGVLFVGYGEGSFNNRLRISSGGSVVSSVASIGVWEWKNAGNQVEVVGAGSRWDVKSAGASGWSGSDLTVGYRASGNSLLVSNGASVVSANAHIGYSDGVKYDADNNRVLIDGTGSTWDSGSMTIGGQRATGNRLDILDGGVVTSSDVIISARYGPDAGNNGVVVSGDGSKWMVSGQLQLYATDYSSENYVRIESGGEVDVQDGLSIHYNPEWDISPSRIDLNDGGRLTIGTDFDASMVGFNYNEGSTLSVSGQLSGLPSLKARRRLETPNVLGDLTVHGIYAPGNSPADSMLNGTLTLAEDGTLEMEMAGYQVGSEYDRLTVSGLSILDGTLDLVFLDDFSPTNGASFDLFNWDGGINGEFASINNSSLSEGLYWDASTLYTTGRLSVIPEPSSAILILLAGGLLYFKTRVLGGA